MLLTLEDIVERRHPASHVMVAALHSHVICYRKQSAPLNAGSRWAIVGII